MIVISKLNYKAAQECTQNRFRAIQSNRHQLHHRAWRETKAPLLSTHLLLPPIEVVVVDQMVLVGRDTFQASGKGKNCPRASLNFACRVTIPFSRMFLKMLWHFWMSAGYGVENFSK